MFDIKVLLIPVSYTIVIWYCLKPFIQQRISEMNVELLWLNGFRQCRVFHYGYWLRERFVRVLHIAVRHRSRSNIINSETIKVNIVVTSHERGISNLRQFDCLFNRWDHRHTGDGFLPQIKGPVTRKTFACHNVVMNYQTRTRTVYPMA